MRTSSGMRHIRDGGRMAGGDTGGESGRRFREGLEVGGRTRANGPGRWAALASDNGLSMSSSTGQRIQEIQGLPSAYLAKMGLSGSTATRSTAYKPAVTARHLA